MSEFTSGDMDTWDTRTSDGRAGYYYLATPYRSFVRKFPHQIGEGGEAHRAACKQAGLIASCGVAVYSPIVHSHLIGGACGIDLALHDFWLDLDRPLLVASIGLIICQLPGWEDSRGIKAELRMAMEAGLPVIYMTPGVVPDCLIRATKCEAVKA